MGVVWELGCGGFRILKQLPKYRGILHNYLVYRRQGQNRGDDSMPNIYLGGVPPLNMTNGNPPFEDVFSFDNGDFPMSC